MLFLEEIYNLTNDGSDEDNDSKTQGTYFCLTKINNRKCLFFMFLPLIKRQNIKITFLIIHIALWLFTKKFIIIHHANPTRNVIFFSTDIKYFFFFIFHIYLLIFLLFIFQCVLLFAFVKLSADIRILKIFHNKNKNIVQIVQKTKKK